MTTAKKGSTPVETGTSASACPQQIETSDRAAYSSRAILNGALQLIESNLDLRLPLVEPGDECATHLRHRLLAIGILRPAPEIARLTCPVCGNPTVNPLPSVEGEYDFFCVSCQAVVDMPDSQYKILALSLETLFIFIARSFGAIRGAQSIELLPGHLWEIGEFVHDGHTVKLLFARVNSLVTEVQIDYRLKEQLHTNRYLVLLSRHASFIEAAQIRQRRVVAVLRDAATLDMDGLHLRNRKALLSSFEFRQSTAAQGDNLTIEADADGSWIRINGITTLVRGAKQRQFVRAMLAAYRKGQRHPRLEDMLVEAGYEGGTTDLKHITRNDEFLALFGYGNGAVWFKAPPTL